MKESIALVLAAMSMVAWSAPIKSSVGARSGMITEEDNSMHYVEYLQNDGKVGFIESERENPILQGWDESEQGYGEK